MERYFFSFPGTEEAFKISDDIFSRIIDTTDIGIAERQRLKLIVSELYMNAYLHGNKADASKSIEVVMEFGPEEFVAIVKDEGAGLTEARFKEMADSTADLESVSGRGIRIVYKLSDKVRVFKDERGKFCVKSSRKLGERPMLVEK
ncbi:MAG: ATP-binding protein [Candidatus Zixiibacteriota bacterium]|nr:MAG: ATP-binding protein [candidate division Zixibacteria bacterium]